MEKTFPSGLTFLFMSPAHIHIKEKLKTLLRSELDIYQNLNKQALSERQLILDHDIMGLTDLLQTKKSLLSQLNSVRKQWTSLLKACGGTFDSLQLTADERAALQKLKGLSRDCAEEYLTEESRNQLELATYSAKDSTMPQG